MSEPIEVGNRVSWLHGHRIGTVTKLYPTIAAVQVGSNEWRYPDLDKLIKLAPVEGQTS